MGARIIYSTCYPDNHDTQFTTLQKILQCGASGGGGSGGGGTVTCGCTLQGDGPPTSPPDDPTVPYIYTDRDTGTLWSWNIVTQAWF